jgi:hypothetical protein
MLNPINSSIILGIILGFFLALILELIIKHFSLCSDFNFVVIRKIYLFIVIIPLHEMLHLAFFPSIKNSTIGIALKKGAFYVTSQDSFTKTRFLTILLLPLIILTIFPFISLFFIKSDLMANIALYNLIGSGVDIIMFFHILKIPSKHLFRFNGTELYIKPASK